VVLQSHRAVRFLPQNRKMVNHHAPVDFFALEESQDFGQVLPAQVLHGQRDVRMPERRAVEQVWFSGMLLQQLPNFQVRLNESGVFDDFQKNNRGLTGKVLHPLHNNIKRFRRRGRLFQKRDDRFQVVALP